MRQLALKSLVVLTALVPLACWSNGADDQSTGDRVPRTVSSVATSASRDSAQQEATGILLGFLLTEEIFATLLTKDEVTQVMTAEVPLVTEIVDLKRMSDAADGPRMHPLDAGYALKFTTIDGKRGLTLATIDLESTTAAVQQYDLVKLQTFPRLQIMDPAIGHASAQMQAEIGEVGSNLVFVKRDKLVTLHTTRPHGEEALVDLEGLRNLARLVEGRLR